MRALSVILMVMVCSSTFAEDIDLTKLKSQLIKHEGKRTKVYKDTEGNPTIGVGFNLNRSDAKAKIEAIGLKFDKVLDGTQELNDAQIDTLLSADMDSAIADCKKAVKSYDKLSDVRKRVVVDMMFNLGLTRFSKFMKMLAAIEAENFDTAAAEMKDSKWCTQVKTRCTTLHDMMKSGNDP